MTITEHIGHQVFERSGIGLAFVDKDGYYIKINQAYCDILDRNRSNIEGKIRYQDITTLDTLPSDEALAKRVMEKTLDGYSIPKSYIPPDPHDSPIHVWLFVTRIEDENGEFECFFVECISMYNLAIPLAIMKGFQPMPPITKPILWAWLRRNKGWFVGIFGAILTFLAAVITAGVEYLSRK